MPEAPAASKARKFRGQVFIDWTRCKGCGFCIDFCPPKILALSEEFNSHGYPVHSKNLKATDSLMSVAVLQRWMNKNLSHALSFGSDSRLRSVIVIVRSLRRLCCHPDVTVMQAAYNWNGNKPARLCDGLRLIGAKGRLAVQTIMRPGDVIILFDVFPQQSF